MDVPYQRQSGSDLCSPFRGLQIRCCWMAALLVCCVVVTTKTCVGQQLERWVTVDSDLRFAAEVKRVQEIIREAASLGFSHLLLDDAGLSFPDDPESAYVRHTELIRETANRWQLQLVPVVFPVDRADNILRAQPDLAAGVPVRNALYVIQNGTAELQADPAVTLPALSALDEWNNVDTTVKLTADGLECRGTDGSRSRILKTVEVAPYRHYRLRIRIQTRQFQGRAGLAAFQTGSNRRLSAAPLQVPATADWSEYSTTFNSLDSERVQVVAGAWAMTGGRLLMQDAVIEECGLLNVLRRPQTPVQVVAEETSRRLQEGEEYAEIRDPLRDREDRDTLFGIDHSSPTIRMRGYWPDGTRLRVSWYHPVLQSRLQVCGSADDPACRKLLDQQARRAETVFPHTDRMLHLRELRVFGWEEPQTGGSRAAGRRLAAQLRWETTLLDRLDSHRRVLMWSDMIDPYQNAVECYSLVHGDLAGSWEGVNPRVTIVNRNVAAAAESLNFFANRGHRQILAGYFDSSPRQMISWLQSSQESKVPGIIGVMYVTRKRDYSGLAEFARLLDRYELAAQE